MDENTNKPVEDVRKQLDPASPEYDRDKAAADFEADGTSKSGQAPRP